MSKLKISANRLFATNAEEVATDFFTAARNNIALLRKHLDTMEEELGKRPRGAFPAQYCSSMMEKALTVYNDIARGNGAVHVRGN